MEEPTHTAGEKETAQPATDSPSTVFFGPDGLRPFWCLLLYLAILLTPILLLLFASYMATGAGVSAPDAQALHHISPLTQLISEWGEFGFVVFATWIMSRIEDRKVFDYGLARTPGRLRWVGIGAVLGVMFQSILILLLWATHHLVFDGVLLGPLAAIGYGLLWAFTFVGVAFFEEFFFRGYLQFVLSRCFAGLVRIISPQSQNAGAIGFWAAAVVISFGFGFSHRMNSGESPIGLLCAGCAGLMFAFSLWRTGSLWWAIGLHAAWDWAQSFLFGVADSGSVSVHRLLATHPTGSPLLSGGVTGPEGSIFVLPVMAAITAVAAFTLPHKLWSFEPEPPYRQAQLAREVNSPQG